MGDAEANRWLILFHQIPPQPSYLRVKIGRRLAALGAVSVKNSVYVLPKREHALEDFQWVRREIVAGGGDASVCEGRFVEGLSDAGVVALFKAAREADYKALARDARALQTSAGGRGKRSGEATQKLEAALGRLRKRFAETAEIDFFGASGRDAVERFLAEIATTLRPPAPAKRKPLGAAEKVRGRTWVTRSGVHVDRIASAWLIRRFIDPAAKFSFVPGRAYTPARGELRFDMFEGEFTHEGELCTFEVLLARFRLQDRALVRVAEIVHDIDLKDGKFQHAATAGIEQLIAGVALRHKDDVARIRDGAAAFDALYEYFKRTK